MATYYVDSSAAGTNAGTSWTNAYTAFGSAVAAAASAGDTILVQYTHQEELALDTTFTIGADNIQIWAVNKASSDSPEAMATNGWIGHSTSNRRVTIEAPSRKVFMYGITLRIAGGGTADNLVLAGDGAHYRLESCYLWQGNTNSSAFLYLGVSSDTQCFVKAINCTFRFGSTSQFIGLASKVIIEGGSISSSGSAVTTVFRSATSADTTGTEAEVHGFDASAAASTATILGDNQTTPCTLRMYACKLPSGAITYLGTQTNLNMSSGELWMHDCAAGDSHLGFVYANALGSIELQTGVYFTATGAAWKITTTAEVNFRTPFQSPWIDFYHAGSSAITPYFEILRDGSTTAYTDAEVWAEFSVKATSGSVLPTFAADRQSLSAYLAGTSASNQASGAGTGSWTGEGGSAWSGKADSSGSVTPAEVGYIRGRVVAGVASSVVYVDPVIRT